MELESIDVVEVNNKNVNRLWPSMLLSIRKATLIAIDLELSGLGCPRGRQSPGLPARYESLREAASTRSVLSLGVALFEQLPSKKNKRLRFHCQVFNVLTLCSSPFTIEPDALQFLAAHSFDFNRLIHHGIPYERSAISKKECCIRSLVTELLGASVPLAVHNGLVDLAFLFSHFYSELPSSLPAFLSDLTDLFPPDSCPVIDSKFLAEFHSRLPSSYLEYVYRRCHRENALEANEGRVHIKFSFDYSGYCMEEGELESSPCGLPAGFPNQPLACTGDELCAQFASHGFCRKRRTCKLVHDVDAVLDWERVKQEKERARRKRRRESYAQPKGSESLPDKDERSTLQPGTNGASTQQDTLNSNGGRRASVSGSHRAGADAFMTGVAVLVQLRMFLQKRSGPDEPFWPAELVNRLPLGGKPHPLHIDSSSFVQSSSNHLDSFMLIQAARRKTQLAKEARSSLFQTP